MHASPRRGGSLKSRSTDRQPLERRGSVNRALNGMLLIEEPGKWKLREWGEEITV